MERVAATPMVTVPRPSETSNFQKQSRIIGSAVQSEDEMGQCMQELNIRRKSVGADSLPEVKGLLPGVACVRSRSSPVLVELTKHCNSPLSNPHNRFSFCGSKGRVTQGME